MIKRIFGTIGTRAAIAVITLLVVILNARYLGAANVGTVSLIVLSITIVQVVNNFIGGGALVYLVPREDLWKLFVPATLWAFLSTFVSVVILHLLALIPQGYFIHVLLLSLLCSFFSVNFMILLGQERIRAYNFITMIQAVTLVLVLLFFLFVLKQRDTMAYIWGMYGSYLLAFALSFILVLTRLRIASLRGVSKTVREIFRYGSYMQFANIFQLFNYRLSYYFIEIFLGRAAVGVYSVGAQISEGVLLISRSISLVQFARISNETDLSYSTRLTLRLVKITFLVTLAILAVLLVLPSSFFGMIFGRDFTGIKMVIACMATGILTLSISVLLSTFFSGIGKPKHNMISSAIGLVFTVILGLVMIPRLGIPGGALAASLSYTMATIYQMIVFIRMSKIRGKDFLVTAHEVRLILGELKGMFAKDVKAPVEK
jgi:O-antigen/teichoic acid export membrane protein